jgi:hypothetical protein
MLAAGLTIVIAGIVITMAMCKAAGKDKWKDKWVEQRKMEKKYPQEWCDNNCSKCDQNDWCMFSEVERGNLR